MADNPKIMDTSDFKFHLESALATSKERIIVISAFLTPSALKWLFEKAQHNRIKVVSRWQKSDLVSGASSLECFPLCLSKGVPFGISPLLHGKVFLVDDQVFLGSANLTSKGIGLAGKANLEFGTGFVSTASDEKKIDELLEAVCWLDEELFQLMENEIQQQRSEFNEATSSWSKEISRKLEYNKIEYLWSKDLLTCSPQNLLTSEGDNDLRNLSINCELLQLSDHINISAASLIAGFHKTNLSKWLEHQLALNGSLSFGKISALLHGALLDDPAPYRKLVKEYVEVLFEWLKFDDNTYEVFKPNHSMIVRKRKL